MSPETAELFARYVVPNYGRFPVTLVRGEGSVVWDDQGRQYLDLFPGWGCTFSVIARQLWWKQSATKLVNSFTCRTVGILRPKVSGAKLLSQHSFGGQAFFCNSGAEANEAAIKLVRLHTPEHRYKIITFQGGFHGRTARRTTATAQPKYHEGLGPLMAGFSYAPFGDLDAVCELVDDQTAGILVEPIQGRRGHPASRPKASAGLRQIADEHELLLVFDEVQAGCGRTGEWFAYQTGT